MNVRNIPGQGGVERNADRPSAPGTADKAVAGKTYELPRADQASITPTGQDFLAKVEGFTNTLRQDDGSREALVEQARLRLVGGELDRPSVYESVAKTLLHGDADIG